VAFAWESETVGSQRKEETAKIEREAVEIERRFIVSSA